MKKSMRKNQLLERERDAVDAKAHTELVGVGVRVRALNGIGSVSVTHTFQIWKSLNLVRDLVRDLREREKERGNEVQPWMFGSYGGGLGRVK